jgi:hypothetical protein
MEAQAEMQQQQQQFEQDQQQEQDPDTGWSSNEFMDAWEDESDDQDEDIGSDYDPDGERAHLLEAAAAEQQQDQHADLPAAQDLQQQGQEAAGGQEDREAVALEILDRLGQLDPDDRTRLLDRFLRRLRRQDQAVTAAADGPVLGADAAGAAHAGTSSEASSSGGNSMSGDEAEASDGAEQDRAGAVVSHCGATPPGLRCCGAAAWVTEH